MLHRSTLKTDQGDLIYTLSSSPEVKNGPAVLYFALSGERTLYEEPFNQPAVALANQGVHLFSWDLPFHTPNAEPQEALNKWMQAFQTGSPLSANFVALSKQNLTFLNQFYGVCSENLAVMGLSRGGYMATQLAAAMPAIKWLLGFAPLTSPLAQEKVSASLFSEISLSALASKLTSKQLRFYIGNDDTKVGTDSCFSFIHHLSKTAHLQGVRSPQVELIISPSIGHKGHGTAPEIFANGAAWLQKQLFTP